MDDLRRCRVGDCEVKLSAEAIRRFQSEVNWSAPSARAGADTLMRRLALEYVTGYLEGGNARLAVYRDNQRPTFVAKEFRAMIDRMPELTTLIPEMRRYLLEYPETSLPNSTSFLYWQDPSRGPGFWFVTETCSRSDGLSGFTGTFVRRRVRSEVQAGALSALQSTKRRLEGSPAVVLWEGARDPRRSAQWLR